MFSSDELAPIILFVYKRLDTTRQVVSSLLRNKYASDSNVFIFSDGFKGDNDREQVLELRDYIHKIRGFASIKIVERGKNLGLERNYVSGVNEVLQSYDRVIVLEDDIDTHPYFLEYMNEALKVYSTNKSVFSVSGYNLPPGSMPIPSDYAHNIFFTPRMMCWGFAVWKDRWELVDWEVNFRDLVDADELKRQYKLSGGMLVKEMYCGRINDSWAIRYDYVQNKHRAYSVCPIRSLVNNIGCRLGGTHPTNEEPSLLNDITYNLPKSFVFPKDILIDSAVLESFNKYYITRYKYYILYRYTSFIYKKLMLYPFGRRLISYLKSRLFRFKS